jgi:hypothetical protein
VEEVVGIVTIEVRLVCCGGMFVVDGTLFGMAACRHAANSLLQMPDAA